MFPPTEDMIKPRAIIDYKQDQVNQQNKILLFFFPESLSSNFKIFSVSVSRLYVSGDDNLVTRVFLLKEKGSLGTRLWGRARTGTNDQQ